MSLETSTFSEASGENWSREREELLHKRIKDLGLKLEGTRLEKIVEHMAAALRKGDLMITLGAGDVWKIGEQVLERLKHGNDKR